MFHSRVLLAAVFLLAASPARAGIGIQSIPDQDIPSGKTLVVPIPAMDPGGPARSYTVTVGPPGVSAVSGTATITGSCGINATIRTGDPHFILGVSYTDSNSVAQTGTMEFQLLREFAPVTTQIIAGLAQGGFYSPTTSGGFVTFYRIVVPPNNPTPFVIQGGPLGSGLRGAGFTFPNEFSNALIFSGSGQLAMANSGYGITGMQSGTGTVITGASNGTNGSEFFITLSGSNREDMDFGYNIFGQMLRGFDTLNGIAGTPLVQNYGYFTTSPVTPVDITGATVVSNNTDAVLLLSATGVCDAVVTVTATSGNSFTQATFTAHAVPDTVNDPPFLAPVPDITAPNGRLRVALHGTDLQLDLMRYGLENILPVYDPNPVTGMSPLVAIPLVTDADNTVEASVDQWNPVSTPHGYDERIFHVGAGIARLRGSMAARPAGANGSLADPVAIFTARNPTDTAASFTASVNCGDGTYLSGSEVTIVKTPGSGNRYKIVAGHTYTTPGEYPLIVKIADAGGACLTLTGIAHVASSSIDIVGMNFSHNGGKLANRPVATFKDYGAPAIPADYSATINWGDGSVSHGIVRRAGPSYKILGSHLYRSPGDFTVSASVSRGGGSMVCEWSNAHIGGVAAPQMFPPFPQAHLAQGWSTVYTGSSSFVAQSGTTSQIYISCSVSIINSGNRRSPPGSFAVYVDAAGTLDGNQTSFTTGGRSSFSIPALEPGQIVTFYFDRASPADTRLYLPAGYDPTGQEVLGVVTYSDPVGDFDGSQKVISVGSF